jgi:hypothetical protein
MLRDSLVAPPPMVGVNEVGGQNALVTDLLNIVHGVVRDASVGTLRSLFVTVIGDADAIDCTST